MTYPDHRAEYYQASSKLPPILTDSWDDMAAWKAARCDAHALLAERLSAASAGKVLDIAIASLPPLSNPVQDMVNSLVALGAPRTVSLGVLDREPTDFPQKRLRRMRVLRRFA